MCAFPVVLVFLCVFLFLLDLAQQLPPVRMDNGCDSVAQFQMPPNERPVFDNCEWCEENCAECIPCYDGKTVFYEEDQDRCERIGGPCSYPFGKKDICAQTCAPVMVKGSEGLHCVEGSASFGEMMLNEGFCQARARPATHTLERAHPPAVAPLLLPPPSGEGHAPPLMPIQ